MVYGKRRTGSQEGRGKKEAERKRHETEETAAAAGSEQAAVVIGSPEPMAVVEDSPVPLGISAGRKAVSAAARRQPLSVTTRRRSSGRSSTPSALPSALPPSVPAPHQEEVKNIFSGQLTANEKLQIICRHTPCEKGKNRIEEETAGDAADVAGDGDQQRAHLCQQSTSCTCLGWRPRSSGLLTASSATTVGAPAAGTVARSAVVPSPSVVLPPVGERVRKDVCLCGHRLVDHGGAYTHGEAEFKRRLAIALEIERVLLEKGKSQVPEYYLDDEIIRLRAELNEKKRSIDSDNDSDLERSGPPRTKRRFSIDGTTSHVVDTSEGSKKLKIEIPGEENKEPEKVPIPVCINTRPPPKAPYRIPSADGAQLSPVFPSNAPRRENAAAKEEREGRIHFRVLTNDGTPNAMMLLTGLKNIFQKQLPKMPREYIGRLVYDRKHLSMAIVSGPKEEGHEVDPKLQVLGGITYRPFEDRGFAEIVFCAISGTEQVKGYGSHLMNHLKTQIKSEMPNIQHFLTYADNYAIGYFKKQGFTTDITLDRTIWQGYIKDYEGGTIMQCTMVPRVDYLKVHEILAIQRAAVEEKVRTISNSHIVHAGITGFRDGLFTELDPLSVKAIRDTGWTPEMDAVVEVSHKSKLYAPLKHIVRDLQNHRDGWPFHKPINADEVPDYYTVIKEPMDLSTMEAKVEADEYETLDQFTADVLRMFKNCRVYNDVSTPYVKCANRLEKFFKEKVKEWNVGLV